MTGRPTRCRHVCPCGAVLICRDPDRCVVSTRWQCPQCELDAADAYWQQQEHDRNTNIITQHEQETHAHERH